MRVGHSSQSEQKKLPHESHVVQFFHSSSLCNASQLIIADTALHSKARAETSHWQPLKNSFLDSFPAAFGFYLRVFVWEVLRG